MTLNEADFFGQVMSKKRGRPPLKKRAMTQAEYKRRYRKSKTARAKREAARNAREEADRALAQRTGGSYAVHHLAVEDATSEHLADASVDAIITDPPYRSSGVRSPGFHKLGARSIGGFLVITHDSASCFRTALAAARKYRLRSAGLFLRGGS